MNNMRKKLFFNNRKNRILIFILIIFSMAFDFYANYLSDNFSQNQYDTITNLYNRIHGEEISLQVDLQLAKKNESKELKEKLDYYEELDKLYPRLNSILEKSIVSKDPLFLERDDYVETINLMETNLVKAYEKGVLKDEVFYIYRKTLRETKANIDFVSDGLKRDKIISLNKYFPSPFRRINIFLSDLYIGILFIIYSLFFADIFYNERKEGYYQLLYFGKNSRRKILRDNIITNYLFTITIFFINIFSIFIINIFKSGMDNNLSYLCKEDFLGLGPSKIISISIVDVVITKIVLFCLGLLIVALLFTLLNLLLKGTKRSSLIISLLTFVSTYLSLNEIDLGAINLFNPIFALYYEEFYFNNNFSLGYGLFLMLMWAFIIYVLVNILVEKYEFLEDSYDFRG